MTTMLAPFQFRQPETLDHLFALVSRLQTQDKRFVFSGGGTDVIALLKQQLDDPHMVISLAGLKELRQIKVLSTGKIQIGALTSLTDLINNREVRELVPALAKAAEKVASPQIRNQATIGGNILVTNRCIYFNQSENNRVANTACFKANGDLCHVVKSATREKLPVCRARTVSDTVPILLLLNAELVLARSDGERRISLRDFFLPDGIDCNDIESNEVLSFIEIDIPSKKRIAYDKLAARDTLDFASMGVAVGVETDTGNGTENTCLSVALTGVHTHPEFFEFRSEDYSSNGEMLKDACQKATKNALTFQQDLFPRSYRKQMVEIYIRRAVTLLAGDKWT
jgi:4-hydroxybenzoyl-CoA reductase beta subunit